MEGGTSLPLSASNCKCISTLKCNFFVLFFFFFWNRNGYPKKIKCKMVK
jgi:hypothetical protein